MGKIYFSALWRIVISYQLFVVVLLVILATDYLAGMEFWTPRILLLAGFIVSQWLNGKVQPKIIHYSEALLVYVLLGFFYTETAFLNTLLFNKMDAFLMRADQWMFGFQPAYVFSARFSSSFFSELMFMGYFSYYLLPIASLITIAIKGENAFRESTFVIFTSFFLYYVLFIILPAEGPQYYWDSYVASIEANGIFGELVKQIQNMGEAPTAAFPSSHVGISLILLVLLYRLRFRLFWIIIPFVFLLIMATVYIKAHYAIDVLAGIISAPIIWFLSVKLFKVFSSAN